MKAVYVLLFFAIIATLPQDSEGWRWFRRAGDWFRRAARTAAEKAKGAIKYLKHLGKKRDVEHKFDIDGDGELSDYEIFKTMNARHIDEIWNTAELTDVEKRSVEDAWSLAQTLTDEDLDMLKTLEERAETE